ncbi:MAG: hypothetical protein J7K68_04630 [Candidatus Diapherotrites archaeon]|nr:hypothetical protein [Candidatus Diapherotrites archaeon]
MGSNLRDIIEFLGKRYVADKVIPPTTMYSSEKRRYRLFPITEHSFKNYNPLSLDAAFSVVAIDGGSAEVFDTAYWGIGYIKLRARKIVFDPKKKIAKTIETESKDKFVLFLTEDEIETKNDDVVKRKFYEKGNYLKREETRFARELTKKGFVDKDELVLIDGTLSTQGFYEQELVKVHDNILGISKRSGMTINRYAASSYLSKLAMRYKKNSMPWYCYPLVAEYPGKEKPIAEIMFASFVSNSIHCFRIDFPSNVLNKLDEKDREEHISEQLSKVAMFSLEPKYRNYPYPLGAVHTDAVMRPRDREYAQEYVKKVLLNTNMDKDVADLIKRDIEEDLWYERFRRRA